MGTGGAVVVIILLTLSSVMLVRVLTLLQGKES